MYHSASEVIREGLRLLKRFNGSSQETRNWYDTQIALALEQAEKGEAVPGEESYERLKKGFAHLHKAIS
jgi:antitoxin ParD1/3/4